MRAVMGDRMETFFLVDREERMLSRGALAQQDMTTRPPAATEKEEGIQGKRGKVAGTEGTCPLFS